MMLHDTEIEDLLDNEGDDEMEEVEEDEVVVDARRAAIEAQILANDREDIQEYLEEARQLGFHFTEGEAEHEIECHRRDVRAAIRALMARLLESGALPGGPQVCSASPPAQGPLDSTYISTEQEHLVSEFITRANWFGGASNAGIRPLAARLLVRYGWSIEEALLHWQDDGDLEAGGVDPSDNLYEADDGGWLHDAVFEAAATFQMGESGGGGDGGGAWASTRGQRGAWGAALGSVPFAREREEEQTRAKTGVVAAILPAGVSRSEDPGIYLLHTLGLPLDDYSIVADTLAMLQGDTSATFDKLQGPREVTGQDGEEEGGWDNDGDDGIGTGVWEDANVQNEEVNQEQTAPQDGEGVKWYISARGRARVMIRPAPLNSNTAPVGTAALASRGALAASAAAADRYFEEVVRPSIDSSQVTQRKFYRGLRRYNQLVCMEEPWEVPRPCPVCPIIHATPSSNVYRSETCISQWGPGFQGPQNGPGVFRPLTHRQEQNYLELMGYVPALALMYRSAIP